ncbi:hypothetical protein B0I37DRAFT_369148 [Chaetomium sp. MPI-CAGE-AT-0009]|nr:hypothetical protein B0I37DRAFT_369148 [Chaetomium sp. MPI-CAGE-AT-0009]
MGAQWEEVRLLLGTSAFFFGLIEVPCLLAAGWLLAFAGTQPLQPEAGLMGGSHGPIHPSLPRPCTHPRANILHRSHLATRSGGLGQDPRLRPVTDP